MELNVIQDDCVTQTEWLIRRLRIDFCLSCRHFIGKCLYGRTQPDQNCNFTDWIEG